MLIDNFKDIHDRMQGDLKKVVCPKCDGCGWVECYSPRPPGFEKCDLCFNPKGNPSP